MTVYVDYRDEHLFSSSPGEMLVFEGTRTPWYDYASFELTLDLRRRPAVAAVRTEHEP